MTTGDTVYQGRAFHGNDKASWYITQATITGIEVDGVPMARMGNLLMPASEYVATREEAKQQIIGQLRSMIVSIQDSIDQISAEIPQ